MRRSVCEKCGQEVVKQGWFWMLPDEVGSKQVKFCPEGGVHEVDEDDEDVEPRSLP